MILKKCNILVLPCGTEIGLEINRSLMLSRHVNVFGISSVDSNHGKYVYKNYIEENIPSVDKINFVGYLNRIIKKYRIDLVYPAHDNVVLSLARLQGSINAQYIGSPLMTCEVCRSKRLTYTRFHNLIQTPHMYASPLEVTDYPVFLKPDVGQGSKGTHIAYNKEEVKIYQKNDPSLMVLEYLPGKEFTIDCFTNNKNELLFVGGRERVRTSNGISINSRIVKDKTFVTIAEIISNELVFKGAWFFQLKVNHGGNYSLLEIAPRIAGTMSLYRNMGVNFPLLSIFDAQNKKVQIDINKYPDIAVDRALAAKFDLKIRYRHVYVDLDDTILDSDSKINIELISFLYQCINNEIQIHLLTRSKKDVLKVLIASKINEIFDEIIVIRDDENKSKYIQHNDSIFIDDSFSERLDVKHTKNIYTFSPDMIESLLE